MVNVTTGGNNPLSKDEQLENMKQFCYELHIENMKLKEDAKKNKCCYKFLIYNKKY